jgi:uroporphyrinogen-III synthase
LADRDQRQWSRGAGGPHAFLRIPPERLKHLQVAAIGPATAVAIGRIGLKVSAMPDEYVAEAVVAMLKEKVVGRRVLLARAAVARDVIPEQLRKCGADIHVVETYRTVIPADSIEQVRELFGEGKPLPDAVTFTSSSTVNNFFASRRGQRWSRPRDCVPSRSVQLRRAPCASIAGSRPPKPSSTTSQGRVPQASGR